MESTCAACGGTFKQRGGRGRPRRYCATCVPSPGVVGSAETARRWRCVNPELAGAAHEDHASGVVDRVAVEVALRRLPEQQRRVLFLREVEDLTQATVADVLGLCERWVREQEMAAWRRLAPLLAEAA